MSATLLMASRPPTLMSATLLMTPQTTHTDVSNYIEDTPDHLHRCQQHYWWHPRPPTLMSVTLLMTPQTTYTNVSNTIDGTPSHPHWCQQHYWWHLQHTYTDCSTGTAGISRQTAGISGKPPLMACIPSTNGSNNTEGTSSTPTSVITPTLMVFPAPKLDGSNNIDSIN